jgi:hypothetical protein
MINRIFTSISGIVDELRPAHTFFNKQLIIAG